MEKLCHCSVIHAAFLSESVYFSFYFVQIQKVGRANGRVVFAALNLLLSVLIGCFSSKSIVRILGWTLLIMNTFLLSLAQVHPYSSCVRWSVHWSPFGTGWLPGSHWVRHWHSAGGHYYLSVFWNICKRAGWSWRGRCIIFLDVQIFHGLCERESILTIRII